MLPTAPTGTFPYRLLAKVGGGAMGEVYRAEDIELGRQVAIKVVKPAFLAGLSEREAPVALQRLVQEARAAAALSHPGATTVHRVGTEGGWPYIAMEWLDGQTLEAALTRARRLPLIQAARLGVQLLSVLDAAHRAGVVHRDIKPGNLMITRDRRLKVTDFGVARLQHGAVARTQAGLVVGTPHYAAPEQLAGGEVDGRADLYSAGAVLYEAVVGRPPLQASSVFDLMRRVQTEEPPPPSRLVAGLPAAFDAFLARALAKDPDQRFASAAEMARALQPFLTEAAPPAAGGGSPVGVASGATASGTLQLQADRAAVPVACVEATTAAGLVAAAVGQWPATALGLQPLDGLLDRLLEKPLHAPAFCGALEVPGAVLLILDGVVHGAFDPGGGAVGDAAVEPLPRQIEATLRACPPGLDPRVVPLLAAAIDPGPQRLAGLDAAFVDLPRLGARLAAEGFDGLLRLQEGARLGLVLYSRGRRVLDLFSHGWPSHPAAVAWERWVGSSGAVAGVEDRRTSFPSITYRRLLREQELEVVRARAGGTASLRSDTRAEAEALELRPRAAAAAPRAGESTVQALVAADPAVGIARWALVDLRPQFDQFRRTSRWRALVEPLDAVETVRLHHTLRREGGRPISFDAATFGADGTLLHVIDRVELGSRQAVEGFLARVTAARVTAARQADGPSRGLAGALLVAPRFTEEALAAYLDGLRAARRRSLRASLDLFSHREGFLVTGGGGCHVLLVEETADGRRRPLVPEA